MFGPEKQAVLLDENALDDQRAFGVWAWDEVVSVEAVQAVVAAEPGRAVGLSGDGAERKQFRLAPEIIEHERRLPGEHASSFQEQQEYEGKYPFHVVSVQVLNIQRKNRCGNDFPFRVKFCPFRASFTEDKGVSL